ncbi:hypothetical protein FRZ00_26365 [Streptomyces mobaraensis]|uniref:Uncharacterized protein n=1 Tax=Streptomyces mobaraensis TaxID=35621 RepID=A0A5N5W1M9_STRMB|nr:hypothetical protein FRZ00_26365 [Streptomyces mobaraensis]
MPRPPGEHGRIQGMPYRPVQFDADDLPTALRRAASWLQETELWLGEAVDVIAVRLDFFEDEPQSYAVKLLCAEDDLDGLTKATSAVAE